MTRPDAVLVDVRTPVLDGLATVEQLAGAPRPAVMMLTSSGDPTAIELDYLFWNGQSTSVGRRRTFEEAEAVTAAAEAFRRRGYESTSVDDLVAATGVHRASLYHVFGSKYGLFRRALDHAVTAENSATPAGLDLALIALAELAPSDVSVRTVLAGALQAGHLTRTALGARLLERAGLPETGSNRSTA